jgi:GNAT superfamily N-acetyltransferase
MIAFRRAVPEDAEALERVRVSSWHSAYAHFLPASALGPLPLERWSRAIASSDAALVATWDGEVVGYATMGPQYDAGPWISTLYIAADYQGKGLGSMLAHGCLQTAREKGYPSLAICVFVQNEPTHQLYLKWGAVEVGRGVYPIDGVDYPDVQLEFQDLEDSQKRMIDLVHRPATSVSPRDIERLYHSAHAVNVAKGLHFSASQMSGEELMGKLDRPDGGVVMWRDELVGAYYFPRRASEYHDLTVDPGVPYELNLFAVDPRFAHMGLGSRILADLEERAAGNGAEWVLLDTAVPATDLIAYYKRHGYAEVGSADYRPFVNYPSVVLGKRVGQRE